MNRTSVSPPASTRPRAVAVRALGLAALAASACSLSQNGVTPPGDTFFFPTSAIMSPTDTAGDWLYVANSNADLRFNDGTLVMVNVGMRTDAGTTSGAAFDRTQDWEQCPQEDYVNPLPRSDKPICCRDLLDSNIINCDERLYVAADATVSIGSFAAGMVWQPYCPLPDGSYQDPCISSQGCLADPKAGRLLIGVRGDTSLTDVDVVPATTSRPAFHCTGGPALTPTLAACDQKVQDTLSDATVLAENLPLSAANPPSVALPDEPYALTLDPTQGFLYVGHLVGSSSVQNSGGVSLFAVGALSNVPAGAFPPPPDFVAPFGGPFPANSSGLFGVTNLHMHEPLGSGPGSQKTVFASSRYVPLVSSMTTIGPQICMFNPTSTGITSSSNQDEVLVPAGDTLNSGLVGSEMRGVEFIDPAKNDPNPPPYAQRVFGLQRVPPDLVGFDISKSQSGATTVIPTDVTETCSSPTFLYQNDAGEGPRLFVNCFDTGEVYVFDPSIPSLISTLMVGRGPAGMVFDATRPIAYVLNFTQNNLVVVDLAPGSPTQYHVVQRLGFPTVTPR
ncbi:MAG TPA: hypothetical protein VI456_08285 [Polyangia bacterium]